MVIRKKQQNKEWIWLAIDMETREIVGLYVGSRDKKGANGLWASLPSVYRQCAVYYTDFWESYKTIFPSKRYYAVGKETGKTNCIERFNCTMGREFLVWFEKLSLFPKKWKIILEQYGILFITIIPLCLL